MGVPNRGPQLIAVVSVLMAFSLTAIILRCYVRISLVKAFGVDDYLMVFAMMTFTAFCAVCVTGVHYGTGRHYWDLQEHDISEALMYWYFCYIWYCVTMILTKISIGYFLLRITVEKIHNWIILIVMSLSVITGICFLFITVFQCHPISFFWNKNQDGTCINIDVIIAFTYVYSAFSVICDFTFAILPIVLIMQLQMNNKTKLALIPVMLMACVASVAVVVRFPYVKDFKTLDFLWATIDIAIWSTVEQGLAITAGSLATIRPLFRKIAAKLGWSTMGSNLPPTGESMGGRQTTGRSRKNKSRDPFSLATFNREEEDESNGNIKLVDNYPGNFQTTITTITADPKSVWKSSNRHKADNESEEELRMEGSKIRSFLITEENV
ncbi:hypothetical protein ACHAPE_003861 [Trichoderma viride]